MAQHTDHDAAHGGDFQLHAVGGHDRTRQAKDADQPCARIGGAAHDGQWRAAVARIDGQHLQLVGLRMLVGGQHLRDAEARELFGRILDAFDLMADAVERRDDIIDGEWAIEMLAQPVEGDLHAEIPPLSVGTFSALNP